MTKKSIISSLIILISLSFSACSSVDVVEMKKAPARAENCALAIYSKPSEILQPYEVACVIGTSTGTSLLANKISIQRAIDLAKPDACKCGADGILVDQVAKEGLGQGSATIKAIIYTNKK